MRVTMWTAVALVVAGGTAAAAEPGWVVIDRVAAVVNQDVILTSDVARRAASIPSGTGQPSRQEVERQVLEAIIDELLFVQQASGLGIQVSDGEVDGAIGAIMKQNQLDQAGLAKALEANGYTMERYREEVRRQITHLRALNLLVRPRVLVTDAEIEAGYKAAKASNPKLGALAAEKDKIRAGLYDQKVAAEAKKWIAEQRALSHIEVRR